jgi:RimJ/RimL family protein N-acetyltransferase
MEVPTLRTERLRLRAPTLDDFATSLAMWSDPVVSRFIGGRPHTPEEVWARLLRYIGHWQAIGYGYWVVEALADGAHVGEVGFGDYRRDIVPPLDGVPEMGWVLAPRAHGHGYAVEAGRAALAWRDAAVAADATVCIIDPAHARSIRVADRLGFGSPSSATYHGDRRVVLWRGSCPAGPPG